MSFVKGDRFSWGNECGIVLNVRHDERGAPLIDTQIDERADRETPWPLNNQDRKMLFRENEITKLPVTYADWREKLENLLERNGIAVNQSFRVKSVDFNFTGTYYRNWTDRSDGIWSIEGMREIIDAIEKNGISR